MNTTEKFQFVCDTLDTMPLSEKEREFLDNAIRSGLEAGFSQDNLAEVLAFRYNINLRG